VISLDCRALGKTGNPRTREEVQQLMAESMIHLLDRLHIPKGTLLAFQRAPPSLPICREGTRIVS
jgi:hypothetical protein